jgi:hypothetical protein
MIAEPRPGAPAVAGGTDPCTLSLDEDERPVPEERVIANRHRVNARLQKLLEIASVRPNPPAVFSPSTITESWNLCMGRSASQLDGRGASGAPDGVADKKEAHSALSGENGLALRQDDIQDLIMRLIRHRRNFANPIRDSDRMNSLDRSQPGQASVIVAGAVPDAMAPSVKARERYEQEIRLHGRRRIERLGYTHSPEKRGLPRTPEAKGQMNSAANDHRQRGHIAVGRQRIKEPKQVGFIADGVKAGNYGRAPEPRQTDAFFHQPPAEARPCVRRKLLPPRERPPAEKPFRIAVS